MVLSKTKSAVYAVSSWNLRMRASARSNTHSLRCFRLSQGLAQHLCIRA